VGRALRIRSSFRVLPVVAAAVALAAAGPAVLPSEANADIIVVQCDTYAPFNGAPVFASGNNAGTGTLAYNGCLASPASGLQINSRGGGYGQGAWW